MASRTRTRVGVVLLPAFVLTVVAGLGIVLWQRGDLNALICDGDCGPSYVIAPRALTTDTTPGAVATSRPFEGSLDGAKVTAALRPLLGAEVLGPRVGLSVLDPSTGDEIASLGSGAYTPASTTKVLTSFAALSLIRPETRFVTKVVGSGSRVTLVGGGDPYLAVKRTKKDERVIHADLATLARRTAASLGKAGTTSVRLAYDASLFRGPDVSPTWPPGYVSENIVTPVSALWADQGVQDGIRARDPAGAAARTFAGLLEDRGITVSGDPTAGKAPRSAVVLATVRSATIEQIVETLIRVSDNQAAEVLLRQAAIAAGKPASFDGGTKTVAETLDKAGVDTTGLRLRDGSGLSRRNLITPLTLTQALRAAASTPRTAGLAADLPVSGFTGTLVNRFAALGSARGFVRAKTGTLRGVHSLAGYASDADGRPVFFAIMSDRSSPAAPLEAQAALDRVVAAISGCRCGT